MKMVATPDSVFRAMTDDGTFRVVTAQTTHTVRGALAAQGATGETARHFANLLTGVVLLRLTMAPQLRVQAILRGSGRSGSLVADSHPSGNTRGLVTAATSGEALDLGQGSLLRLMRTLQDGSLQQGVVEVPKGGIAPAFMTYLSVSEQVSCMIGVGAVIGDDGAMSAGGYLVQILPEAQRGPLMIMSERLEEFRTIDDRVARPDFSPSTLMSELLYGMPFTPLAETDVRFECWCSHISVVAALSSLPRTEVQSMIDDGDVLEIRCDYCNAQYRVSPAELRGLLDAS
ncbi:MAG TPA: Hsp33 family molecular chaperone HslO [Polyangiaceae bacterium]|jgi:molecular chaperone Hsp33|nr:Hsp33 family molecular chaperone HslO [Polyangiaceae bacterium]